MTTTLSNKNIILTGASKGFGSLCARALAANGARLVLIARSQDLLQEVQSSCENSGNHLVLAADLTDPLQLKEAVSKAEEFLGVVDVVLHVAGGGLGLRDPFLSAADLDKLLTLNIKVAVDINRLLLPSMLLRHKGNIVHVGSIASSEVVASVGYNTSRAALAGYVRSMGREVAGSGVVVTGILPGAFYAPGNSWERLEKNKPEVVQQFIKDRLPRGFLGKAEELLPMILLLCSDSASMMGGCLVPIDAGEGRSYLI